MVDWALRTNYLSQIIADTEHEKMRYVRNTNKQKKKKIKVIKS